ncbi:MAG: tetratricopeptide repeat protein [Bacteroidales bacterium]|jgi:tetratricopeptide (TPR) repeat protein|nr:tetratricopeptide repeat protein [Bacteroidales bacterium]
MKKIGYKFLGIVSVGLFMVLSVSAQPGSVTGTKFGRGQDSIDCRRDLSLFAGDYQHKNYKDAIVYWRRLMKNCPQSSPNLIPRGLTMYKDFISKELDPSKKDALVDTLMQVYQIGIETRPNKANLMVNKLQDMERYANETPAQKKRLLTASEEYMNLEKEKSQPRSMVTYMKTSIELNNEGALTDEELLDNYTKVSDVLNAALKKTSDEELAKARDQIDDAFAKSPAANCENLAKIYGPKFETDKNDLEFLSKLTRLLNRNECTDSELFEKAAEQQVALDPSAAAAYNMAKLFFRKGNFEKSLEYFESAIEHEKDPIDKANYYCQMGNVLLDKMQKYTEAKNAPLKQVNCVLIGENLMCCWQIFIWLVQSVGKKTFKKRRSTGLLLIS